MNNNKNKKKKSRAVTIDNMWTFLGCSLFAVLFGLATYAIFAYLSNCNWDACKGNCEIILTAGSIFLAILGIITASITVIFILFGFGALLAENYEDWTKEEKKKKK